MNEPSREIPYGLSWKEESRAGLKFLTPDNWFYKFGEEGQNLGITSSESLEHDGWVPVGLMINIFKTDTGKPAISNEEYKRFLLTLPNMFKDMEPVGEIKMLEDDRIPSTYHSFISREGVYVDKKTKLEEVRRKCIFRVRASIDLQNGSFILARFATTIDQPENLQIADPILQSITLTSK